MGPIHVNYKIDELLKLRDQLHGVVEFPCLIKR